jgi:hypothetical protein
MRRTEPFSLDDPKDVERAKAYEERRGKEIERFGITAKDGSLLDVRNFRTPTFGKQEVDS